MSMKHFDFILPSKGKENIIKDKKPSKVLHIIDVFARVIQQLIDFMLGIPCPIYIWVITIIITSNIDIPFGVAFLRRILLCLLVVLYI